MDKRRTSASLTYTSNEHDFLQHTLTELKSLEEEAETHHHGVLAQMLKAARYETEILVCEASQAEAWPRSTQQPHLKIR
jgi:hypothetical protein